MGWCFRSLAGPRDDRGFRVSTVAGAGNDPSRSALEILRCSRGGCSICDSTSGPYTLRSYFDELPPRRGLRGRMFHLGQPEPVPPPRSYFESLSTSGPTLPSRQGRELC